MRCKVMTWNTRMYEYGNKVRGYIRPIDEAYFNSVIKVISEHLKKENAIAILQEIPYVCNVTWKEHELFSQFKKLEHEFFVKYNISSKNQIMMTVIISQKELIEWDENGFNDNRSVSFIIKNTKTKLLGLHAKNNSDTASYLDNIRSQYPDYYHYILGDFNSGNYTKKEEDTAFCKNRTAYCGYLEKYTDICNGQITTIYGTPIDHILTKKDMKNKYKCCNVNVSQDYSLSDHCPISFDIIIN